MWGCCCCCCQVDCTKEQQLCKDHFVTAFPSIRVFRKAHDDVMVNVSGSVTAGVDHKTSPAFWAGSGLSGAAGHMLGMRITATEIHSSISRLVGT